MYNLSLSTDCSIQDYDVFSYNESLIEPSNYRGYYRYVLPCGGILTSIKARGFCGRADNVQLRLLFGSGIPGESYDSFDILLIEAKCNKTASSSVHEGQVVNDTLYLYIPPNGFLSVFFNPDCTKEKCFFQPAIVNESSNHTLMIIWSILLLTRLSFFLPI